MCRSCSVTSVDVFCVGKLYAVIWKLLSIPVNVTDLDFFEPTGYFASSFQFLDLWMNVTSMDSIVHMDAKGSGQLSSLWVHEYV